MVLAATPNKVSSGLRRACSTSHNENDLMALMKCPSVLSTQTLVGHFCACNALLQTLHTIRSMMRCLRPFQIRHHRVSYKAISSWLESDSFEPKIFPFLLSAHRLYRASRRCSRLARCGARSPPKSCFVRPANGAVATWF